MALTGSVTTSAAAIGIQPVQHSQLSTHLKDDLPLNQENIVAVQNQIDLLTLQNCRGLNSITTEKGGTCMALNEDCGFYATQSGIV